MAVNSSHKEEEKSSEKQNNSSERKLVIPTLFQNLHPVFKIK